MIPNIRCQLHSKIRHKEEVGTISTSPTRSQNFSVSSYHFFFHKWKSFITFPCDSLVISHSCHKGSSIHCFQQWKSLVALNLNILFKSSLKQRKVKLVDLKGEKKEKELETKKIKRQKVRPRERERQRVSEKEWGIIKNKTKEWGRERGRGERERQREPI